MTSPTSPTTDQIASRPQSGPFQWDGVSPIRLLFIAQYAAVWPSLQSVWRAASEDPRFAPVVVLAPFIHQLVSESDAYDELREHLLTSDVPFTPDDCYDVELHKPHVAFVPNPYDETRPEPLQLDGLLVAGARIGYVPYGLEIGGGAWNFEAQFNSRVHQAAWRIFSRSRRHRAMFGRYCQVGNSHVVVTGHPKFDLQAGVRADQSTRSAADPRTILWTPHFSVGQPAAWSTFHLFGDFIVDEVLRRQDIKLLIRPHPLLFHALHEHGFWTATDETDFRMKVEDNEYLELDEEPDYLKAFARSDALLADLGSFLLEYLVTKKPLLHLHDPKGLGLNDDADLLDYIEVAESEPDIADFIAAVVAGQDRRREERLEAAPGFIHNLHGGAGRAILDAIYSGMSEEIGLSSLTLSAVHTDPPRIDSWADLLPSDLEEWDCEQLETIRRCIQSLGRVNRALDLGSAYGTGTIEVSRIADSVIAVDPAAHLIIEARVRAERDGVANAEFLHAPLDAYVPLEKFDLISCFWSLSRIPDNSLYLRLLDRITQLSHSGTHVLFAETVSTSGDQRSSITGVPISFRQKSGFVRSLTRRSIRPIEEVSLSVDPHKNLETCLWVCRTD